MREEEREWKREEEEREAVFSEHSQFYYKESYCLKTSYNQAYFVGYNRDKSKYT